MGQLHALLKKEFLLLIRDRQATLVLFLMPIIFIFILSVALQDVFSDKVATKVKVAILAESGSQDFAEEFKKRLEASSHIEVLFEQDFSKAEATLKITEKSAKEFEKISQSGLKSSKKPESSLSIQMEPTLSSAYRWFVKVSISNALYQMILDKAEKKQAQEPSLKDPLGFLNDEPSKKKETLNLSDFLREEKGESQTIVPTSLQQNVPGWSLFAMFFIAIPLASGILKERQDGTIKRLLTLPVSKSTLILGKLISFICVNLLQFIFMLLVGLYLIPLCTGLKFQLGSHAHHLVFVTLVAAFTATSYGIFISCISQSIEQASALSAGIVICMAALGGIMVPIFAMPIFMQQLAKLSPLYWGHQAYLDVLVREVPLGIIAPKLFILLVFAFTLLFISKRRFQWL